MKLFFKAACFLVVFVAVFFVFFLWLFWLVTLNNYTRYTYSDSECWLQLKAGRLEPIMMILCRY